MRAVTPDPDSRPSRALPIRAVPGARVAAALVVPLWRTLPWRTLGAAAAVGLLVVGAGRAAGAGPVETLYLLRGAGLALALGVAFLLDDPARHTTTPVPVRRAVRTLLRAALVTPVAGLWWAAVLLLVPGADRPPAGDLTLEAGTAFLLALAGAAVAVRYGDAPEPGRPVATALLATAVLAPLLLPDHWALFVSPTDPGWAAGHERWAWLLTAAAALWTASLHEPRPRHSNRATPHTPA
ncbi:ABC transporter [Streptomyces sp. NPDC004232]|uniref:ABC transporter n=1 Tax=Streptomyces sp. NPDC004232 TaxID=3154454 RepID=UPI0033AD5F5B